MTVLALSSVLNARSLSNAAHQRQPGWQRDVAIDVTDVVLDVAEATGLDRPARWVEDIRGDDEEPIVTTGPPPAFVPTEQRPAHLWITGDSLTNTVGPAVVRAANDSGVIEPRDEVVYSSGLTRPDFFDWPTHLRRGLAQEPTEIVVFMVGANDGQPIETGGGWVTIDDPAWSQEYRLRVRAAMEVLEQGATTSFWVGQPITRSAEHSANVALMNDIFESEAEQRPTVHYVDAWELFVDETGGYSDHLPDASGDAELVRADDGVHLTDAGAERLADLLMGEIAQLWELPG